MAEVSRYGPNFSDSVGVDGGAGRIDEIDPATGDRIAEHALADAANVDRATEAARRVQLSGARAAMPPMERGRMVQAMGRYLRAQKDESARILTLQPGKPLWQSRFEDEGRSISLGAGGVDWTCPSASWRVPSSPICTAPLARCAPVRFLATRGTQGALRPRSAPPAMAAIEAVTRLGITCRPRLSRSR
jgi:hypothetical protein